MNGAHFHLVVNHLPIIFPLVGAIVLITGIISKSDAVKRTAYLIFILGAIAAIVSTKSGEEAEEVVEKMSGVSEKFIEIHEETAEKFAIMCYILGGVSLVGLWANFKQKAFSNIVSYFILLFAFIVLFFARQTGTTGAEIRHTEIRNDTAITPENDNNKVKEDGN
jgi:uncharacterized membrane protein